MERKELKTLLASIKENKYAVPEGINPYELSLELMNYLGDTEVEMRDELVYHVLVNWILEDALTPEEAHHIFMESIDEKHLFNGLGEISDKVFDRTYSVLIAGCIIYKHRDFLPDSDILKAFHNVLKFYNEDKDVRGFVEVKGWAHGAAHGADALAELVQCKIIGYEELKAMLDAIYKKINIDYYGYIQFEEERMISIIDEILARDIIPIEEIEEWIRSFGNIEKPTPYRAAVYHDYMLVTFNVTMFLKSLYFRLPNKTKNEKLVIAIKEVLKKISIFGEYYS